MNIIRRRNNELLILDKEGYSWSFQTTKEEGNVV